VGCGDGPHPQSPIPNLKSPIPNPQSPLESKIIKIINKKLKDKLIYAKSK
jgi:hypothetical protein